MKFAMVLFGLLMVATLSWGSPFCSHCPRQRAPVCGVNGVTYYNKCHLSCVRVPIAYAGACRLGARI